MFLGQWLGFVALVLSLYILWQIRQMLLVVFAAIVLATTLNKLAQKIQHQFKLTRTVGILAAISIFIGTLICFFVLIVPPFISQSQELTTTKLPAILKSSSQWGANIASYIPAQLIPYLPNIENLTKQIQPLLQSFAGQSLTIFSNSLGALLNLLFMIILTIMLLAQPTAYRRAFIALFPSFYRRRVDGILAECELSLGKWVGGAMLSMVVVAALSLIGLLSLGIPLALAQAILAGLLNFVPNLGPTISVVIPVAIALLDEPWKAVAIFVIYFLIQQFESSFLAPYIMSHQVSLLPAITLIAQVFFTTFFGFMGLLLALPLTVVAKVWINAVLIEDILDRWKYLRGNHDRSIYDRELTDPWQNPPIETELVVTGQVESIDATD
ncbi:MAG: AI-2E family transporter [Chamaesiphon sp.]|nr:AI-2E family transporter [Chamaesiphon sp.]